ncbi:MAG: hypothetical protein LUC44_06035, partial [Prevotellaceae bacterium]|nr:hypothetical protein [Prevotellaceae bacterium]
MNPSCPITFSEEGRLLNGQHRLKAVVKSGKTVRMAVMRGVSVKDFSVIDTGMMRTSSDILSIAQVPNYTSVASIIGRYLYYSDANYGRMFTSREEVLDIYLADSEFWQYACQFARRLNDTKVRLLTVAEIGGIMGFL